MSSLGRAIASGGNVMRGYEAGVQRQRVAREQQLLIEERNRLDRLRQLSAQQPLPQAPNFSNMLGEPVPVVDMAPAPAAPAAPAPMPPAAQGSGRGDIIPPPVGMPQPVYPPANVPLNQPYRDPAGYTPPANLSGPEQLRRLQEARLQRFANPRQTAKDDAAARAAQKATQPAPFDARTGFPSEPSITAPAAPTGPLSFSNLAAAVEQVESGGRVDAVSPKGAVGPMQTMPGTLRDPGFGVRPAQNNTPAEMRRVGQDYLAAMLTRYGGNLDHALAAYNWGPTNADKWIADGADPSKLPKETREYIPKVKAAMGMETGAATAAAPAAPADTPVEAVAEVTRKDPADFYLANPQAVPRDMQIALRNREELVRMASLYQQSGMGTQFMEVRTKIMELDDNLFYLQGMQGLQEITMANDPRRLSTVWSQAVGVPVNVIPRTDGKFNITVNGRVTREGVDADTVADMARSSFDVAFRQQKAEASAKFNEKMQESMLKIQEGNALELAKMIRETTVEGVKGNNALTLEWAKANLNWDIKPTGAGDGTVIIRPPGSPPYLFNPTGADIIIDGVKVPANSARLIGGLPQVAQARQNQVR